MHHFSLSPNAVKPISSAKFHLHLASASFHLFKHWKVAHWACRLFLKNSSILMFSMLSVLLCLHTMMHFEIHRRSQLIPSVWDQQSTTNFIFYWVMKETTLHCYLSKSWQFADAQGFFQSWLIMSKLDCEICCGCVVSLWTLTLTLHYRSINNICHTLQSA